MSLPWAVMNSSSRVEADHRGYRPPAEEMRYFPPGPGNGLTKTSFDPGADFEALKLRAFHRYEDFRPFLAFERRYVERYAATRP
jgi:hypothetical protein